MLKRQKVLEALRPGSNLCLVIFFVEIYQNSTVINTTGFGSAKYDFESQSIPIFFRFVWYDFENSFCYSN